MKFESKFVIQAAMKQKMKSEILNSIDDWKGLKKGFLNNDDCFKKSNPIH